MGVQTMERYLLSFLGVLFSGSIGAFLLFVPSWAIIAVAVVLVGLAAMFLLGVHVGRESSTSFAIDRDIDGLADASVGGRQSRDAALHVAGLHSERS